MNRLIVSFLALNLAGVAALLFLNLRATKSAEISPVFSWPEIEKGEEDLFTYRAELVRVIDGDTVVLDVDLGFETWLHNQTIRLYGINTPEIRGKEKAEGLEAKAWLESRLDGREIILRTIQDEKGSFGRWLGIIFTDGENVNDELIENQLAVPFAA